MNVHGSLKNSLIIYVYRAPPNAGHCVRLCGHITDIEHSHPAHVFLFLCLKLHTMNRIIFIVEKKNKTWSLSKKPAGVVSGASCRWMWLRSVLCRVPVPTKIRKGRGSILCSRGGCRNTCFPGKGPMLGSGENQRAEWGQALKDLGLIRIPSRLWMSIANAGLKTTCTLFLKPFFLSCLPGCCTWAHLSEFGSPR